MKNVSNLAVFLLVGTCSASFETHGHIARGAIKSRRCNNNSPRGFANVGIHAKDSALALKGGDGDVITDEMRAKAKISTLLELIWSVANAAFGYLWLAKKFDARFVENGFCANLPPPEPGTHKKCSAFDLAWAAATIGILINRKDSLRRNFPEALGLGVLYPIVHGVAHGLIGLGVIKTNDKIELSTAAGKIQALILAAILSIGPIGVKTSIEKKHPRTERPDVAKWSVGVALVLEALLVATYLGTDLNRNVNVLAYINVTVNFVLFASQLVLFGRPTDENVIFRNKIYGPLFVPSMATISFLVLVMWIEATSCSAWFAKAGGHIWFDVALIAMGLVTIANMISAPPSDVARRFFF